jgi:hypothetical protein
VDFHLISQHPIYEGPTGESASDVVDSPVTSQPWRQTRFRETSDQKQKPESEIEKSGPKSETEIEDREPSRRPGRRPRTPLMNQVEEAYLHFHDWDWLQECDLAKLPQVQQRVNPRQIMPEAQALRGLLLRLPARLLLT